MTNDTIAAAIITNLHGLEIVPAEHSKYPTVADDESIFLCYAGSHDDNNEPIARLLFVDNLIYVCVQESDPISVEVDLNNPASINYLNELWSDILNGQFNAWYTANPIETLPNGSYRAIGRSVTVV